MCYHLDFFFFHIQVCLNVILKKHINKWCTIIDIYFIWIVAGKLDLNLSTWKYSRMHNGSCHISCSYTSWFQLLCCLFVIAIFSFGFFFSQFFNFSHIYLWWPVFFPSFLIKCVAFKLECLNRYLLQGWMLSTPRIREWNRE